MGFFFFLRFEGGFSASACVLPRSACLQARVRSSRLRAPARSVQSRDRRAIAAPRSRDVDPSYCTCAHLHANPCQPAIQPASRPTSQPAFGSSQLFSPHGREERAPPLAAFLGPPLANRAGRTHATRHDHARAHLVAKPGAHPDPAWKQRMMMMMASKAPAPAPQCICICHLHLQL